MADKKNKKSKVLFHLLVRDTFYKKFNWNSISLLLFITVGLFYNLKFIFVLGLILLAFVSYAMFNIQKEYRVNLSKWDEDIPDGVTMWVNREDGRVYANGYEFYTKDIKWVRFKVKNIPTQTGISGVILKATFINAYMEFELNGGKFVDVPIQSKAEIRAVVDIFTALDVKSSFDITVYKACGLK